MKAINIKWDTDGDMELFNELPTEMKIPDYLVDTVENLEDEAEEISDWLSDTMGFCHFGFELIK